MILGRDLPACGILIEPHQPAPTDLDQYLDSLWPVIEQANSQAPEHSKIQRHLIIIGDPVHRPIPKTVKGNNRRNEAAKIYDKEIVEAYKRYAKGGE